MLELVRALGLVRGLRGVEQNPETAYVLEGALRAYPQATAVHVIRDGRDVVCSLLERGWLRAAARRAPTTRVRATARTRASGSSRSGGTSSSTCRRRAGQRGLGGAT